LENELHPKHHGISPKKDKERFEIIIGAILTQNTNWKNVEKAIFNLNKAKLVDINKIKKINKKKLASLIRPSGYYNQKAEKLKIVADFFSKNKNPTREQLLEVKGIGPETADSILLYALNKPFFVVDAYTKRIFSRIGLCNGKCSYDELQKLFHKNLPKKTKLFNQYHALLVELGKNFCKKKPLCKECPLNKLCKKIF
jgi:endonuclease-3 related protein